MASGDAAGEAGGEPRWSARRALAAYRLPLILVAAIGAGIVAGAVFGEDARMVRPLGDLFLNLMFTLVVPHVLFSISSAVANMSSLRRLGRIAWRMLAIFTATGLLSFMN